MKLLSNLTRIPLAFGLVTVLAACSAKPVQVQGYQPVAETDGLVLDHSHAPSVVYVRPGAASLREYDNFIIDPVIVVDGERYVNKDNAESIAKMQQYLAKSVSEELSKAGYQIGGETTDNTLRITFKISGVSAPSAVANVTTVLAPFALSVGEVTIETVFREAASERIDAVAVMQSRGSRFLNSTPWSTWADVEQTFDSWAQSFRQSVDQAYKA
ncbi:DUF3313 family protein [Agarivorans aestuarii]|uniref:DUF3313 family protein n=1 Tax=Agarivorans aestuarii TaxID=1563703 RepID=UPI001C7E8F35|nr:DUF3313 family protein [Agarivorans aestuarii]